MAKIPLTFGAKKLLHEKNQNFTKICGIGTAQDIATDIEKDILRFQPHEYVGVETIQDWVENYLMRSERPDVEKAYIRYRYKKEVAREFRHDFIDAIAEKLEARNV